MDKATRRPDNAARALNSIRSMIDSGAFPEDGRLPTERDLSQRLDVGRGAVRRALEALEAEGLVWRKQGKGTFVGQPPDPSRSLAAKIVATADPLSVMEARLGIEPTLAALCARRASGEDVEKLRHIARRTAVVSHDSDSVEMWDGALHHFIAKTAGNPLLTAAFNLVDQVRMDDQWQIYRHRARSPEKLSDYACQHEEIIDAIAARDPEGARAAMTRHLELLRDALQDALQGDRP